MRVAIVTFPLVNNYGGIIQAYALMELIKELGHQPILVNLQPERKIKALSKYFIHRYLLFFSKNSRSYPKLVRDSKLNNFIMNYMVPKTIEIRNSHELRMHFQKVHYDACIVGSDQVFASMGFTNFINDFSLGFVPDYTLKLSYAASFGGSGFRGDKTTIPYHAENLKKFDAISVREKSAVNICKELFEVDSLHVLDPTMMMNKSFYIRSLGLEHLSNQREELFAYVLDSSDVKRKLLSEYAFRRSISLNLLNDGNKSGRVISMESWLESILNAKHVITDSFHGCVFCIIFNKPFHCFVNEQRGADRFYSLLGLFGLETRIIKGDTDSIVDADIDWSFVNERLSVMRKVSEEFLINGLLKS